MSNREHVEMAKRGSDQWNAWRNANRNVKPDLSGADLARVDLGGALLYGSNLSKADLSNAMLQEAQMTYCNLNDASLTGAVMNYVQAPETSFRRAILWRTQLRFAELSSADFTQADAAGVRIGTASVAYANFTKAKLQQASFSDSDCRFARFTKSDAEGASFHQAFLRGADFTGANLRSAILSHAVLAGAKFERANLTDCSVHGIAAWDVRLEGAVQKDLIITPELVPRITVDRLEVAQFAYLLLYNPNLRRVIDTIIGKSVLILGRFTPERKSILDALRDELRRRNFLPIVFDFDGPASQDITETIKTLAGLSRFVIADITNPRSSPLELQATVPDFMIPFIPILQRNEQPFSMFADLQNKYDWVMDVLTYDSKQTIVDGLDSLIIEPALRKHAELIARKGQQIRMRDMQELLSSKKPKHVANKRAAPACIKRLPL